MAKCSFTIQIDEKLRDKLDELADVLRISRTKLINELLADAVADNETYIRLGAKVARGLEQMRGLTRSAQPDFLKSEEA